MGAVVAERPGEGGRSPAVSATNRATWYSVSAGNDVYFRAEAPAKAVGGRVALIPEADVVEILGGPNLSESLPWTLVARTPDGVSHEIISAPSWTKFVKEHPILVGLHAEFPEHEGVAVFARPDLFSRGTLIAAMREQGVRVLTETDDNYLAPASQNIVMRSQATPKEQRYGALAMATGDGMVFSTKALRDTYVTRLRGEIGKKQTPPSFVCRNHVPRWDWPERDEGDGRLRVGFMGSVSHVWDLAAMAYPAFEAAHEHGCETVMIGYNPADPDPGLPDVIDTDDGPVSWRSDKSLAEKQAWARVIDRAIKWVEPGEYRRASLPLDIGLCPLRTDQFTLGKSDSKALEYAINGAAIVCTNNRVYHSEGWKHEQTCLMANSPREFMEQTMRLVRDKKLRYELASAAQEYVSNERNENALRLEWGAALG